MGACLKERREALAPPAHATGATTADEMSSRRGRLSNEARLERRGSEAAPQAYPKVDPRSRRHARCIG